VVGEALVIANPLDEHLQIGLDRAAVGHALKIARSRACAASTERQFGARVLVQWTTA
jgi:hypothetical protein